MHLLKLALRFNNLGTRLSLKGTTQVKDLKLNSNAKTCINRVIK